MSTKERLEFSERLRQTLKNAEYIPDSPTQLAREFNLRFDGNPITVHAARKWLMGEAIPTQEKLRILSQWLGVPPEWLRFGTDSTPPKGGKAEHSGPRIEPRDLVVLESLRRLDDKHRRIAQTVIRLLVHANEGK